MRRAGHPGVRATLRSLRTGLVTGAVCGLVAPLFGLVLGLQVSPVLGTVVMAPFVALSSLTGTPFGEMSGFERWVGLTLSILTGAALGAGLQHICRRGLWTR